MLDRQVRARQRSVLDGTVIELGRARRKPVCRGWWRAAGVERGWAEDGSAIGRSRPQRKGGWPIEKAGAIRRYWLADGLVRGVGWTQVDGRR